MCGSPYVHMLTCPGIRTHNNKHASGLYVCMYGRMIFGVSFYVHMLQWTGICTYINKHASGLYVCMYGRMICVFVGTRKYMCVNCNFKCVICNNFENWK